MELLREEAGSKNKEEKSHEKDKKMQSFHTSDNSNLLKCFKLMERMVV